MKILLTVSHRGVYTGASVQLAQLAVGLAGRGHDVTALFKSIDGGGAGNDKRIEEMTAAGVKLERFNFRKLKHRDTLPELLRLRKFLREEKFDVIQCFKGTDFDFVIISSIGIHIPAFIVYRGMGAPLDFFNSFKYRSRKVNKIIAVSEATKRTIIESGKIAPDKIEVVYSGVDLSVFDLNMDGQSVRGELGIPCDAQVVGIVGSFDFRPGKTKGGYEFLRAARMVLDKKPDTLFLCVGGIDVRKFEAPGKELGIADRFVFTGYRTDVPRMFAAMDLSVCASIRPEGLMGAVRESLAMAVPVVSTDVGGNGELVRDNETGLLVPPGDVDALANGILTLLENPQKARDMGVAGRRLVEKLCDSRKQVERVEELYMECLGGKPKLWACDG